MTNYYYILSSLPNLSLDKRPSEEELDEAIALIKRQCDEGDLAQIQWFYYRNECFNLIEYWQHQFGHIPSRPLRKPYIHPEKDFKFIDQDLEILPPFLMTWYEEEREHLPFWSINDIENRVQTIFFNAAEDLEPSFIKSYFEFEHQLRGLMATFHQGEYEFINQDLILSNETIAGLLKRRPLRLSDNDKLQYPHLESLLLALKGKDPIDISLEVHKVLWVKADELASGHYYDRISLLNYVAKLFLLYRREQLFQNQNEPHLQRLVNEALQKIESHD